jgi:hypothetical protein
MLRCLSLRRFEKSRKGKVFIPRGCKPVKHLAYPPRIFRKFNAVVGEIGPRFSPLGWRRRSLARVPSALCSVRSADGTGWLRGPMPVRGHFRFRGNRPGVDALSLAPSAIPRKPQRFRPVGSYDNSPAIHRWGGGFSGKDGRFRPPSCWAIVACPFGTQMWVTTSRRPDVNVGPNTAFGGKGSWTTLQSAECTQHGHRIVSWAAGKRPKR